MDLVSYESRRARVRGFSSGSGWGRHCGRLSSMQNNAVERPDCWWIEPPYRIRQLEAGIAMFSNDFQLKITGTRMIKTAPLLSGSRKRRDSNRMPKAPGN